MSPVPADKQPITRLVYVKEGHRIVTIAYQIYYVLEKKEMDVKFAASMFCKQSQKEVFVRKQHAHTAQSRLVLRPHSLTVPIPEVPDGQHLPKEFYEDLVKKLRSEIVKRGTGSDRAAFRASQSSSGAQLGVRSR